MSELSDLEPKVASGQALAREEAERVLACTDLTSVGALGELARTTLRGSRVTFGRVCVVDGDIPANRGQAGEVRLAGRPESIDEARERVRTAGPFSTGVPLTGFSLGDLLELVGGDHLALAELSRALRHDGLAAVAEAPIDRLGDAENASEVLRAVLHGGLQAWRATIDRTTPAGRLDLIERAIVVQEQTRAFKAFAPLARDDPRDQPSTGYDDVRTIAVARLMGMSIPSIQVDWPLYGPKLAQVAIAYGADDVDGIAAFDEIDLGHRRSAREEIERHIRQAFAEPVERDGRFEIRA